jgi:hypothetical protein
MGCAFFLLPFDISADFCNIIVKNRIHFQESDEISKNSPIGHFFLTVYS